MRFTTLFAAGLLFSSTLLAAPVKFDKSSGTVEWVGKKNLGDKHEGTIDLKSGSLDLASKKGEFVIDMTTINPTDLKDPKDKAKLAGHLGNEDFFFVSKYPEAKFVVKDIVKDASKKDVYKVSGDLTIKDVTKPQTIEATIVENGKVTTLDSSFTFSRSAFGVKFNSKEEVEKKAADESAVQKAGKAVKEAADKMVRKAGDKWIVDDIELKLKLKSI